MPIVKIFDFDRECVITKAFKLIKVKGVGITLITPEDEQIHIYGKIIEVKEISSK